MTMLRSSLWMPALVLCGVMAAPLAGSAPSWAAPAKGGKGQKANVALSKPTSPQWAAAVAEYDATLERDAASAPAWFRKFLAEHPDMKAAEAVSATEDAASRLAAHDTVQLDAALGLLNEAVANPRFAPEALRFQLVNRQAMLLRQNKRFAEVETLLQKHWSDAMKPGRWVLARQEMLWHYVEALHKQSKHAEAEALMWQALAQHPLLVDWGTLRSMMLRSQQEQGHDAQALSWAKLNFMLAAFDEKSINSATATLTKAWMQGELNLEMPRAFAAAQTDAQAPNPLDEVALPLWPAPVKEALLKASGSGAPDNRVTALLALERYREAMELARDALVRDPTSKEALERVARVFKAADGDVVRANAFLSYYSTGAGENPMAALLAAPDKASK